MTRVRMIMRRMKVKRILTMMRKKTIAKKRMMKRLEIDLTIVASLRNLLGTMGNSDYRMLHNTMMTSKQPISTSRLSIMAMLQIKIVKLLICVRVKPIQL